MHTIFLSPAYILFRVKEAKAADPAAQSRSKCARACDAKRGPVIFPDSLPPKKIVRYTVGATLILVYSENHDQGDE